MHLQCNYARWILRESVSIRDICHLLAINPCLNSRAFRQEPKLVPVAVHHRFIANQVFFRRDPCAVALVENVTTSPGRFSNIHLWSVDGRTNFPRIVGASQLSPKLNARIEVRVVEFDFQFEFKVAVRFNCVQELSLAGACADDDSVRDSVNCVLSRDGFQPSRLLPSNSVAQSSAKVELQEKKIAASAMVEKHRCVVARSERQNKSESI